MTGSKDMPEVMYIDWPPNRSGFVVGCIEPFNAVEFKYLLADTSISKADHDKTIAMMNFILLEKDKLYKAQLVELQKQLIDLLENKPFSFNTDTIKEVFKEVV